MTKARIRVTGINSKLQGVGRLTDGRAAFVPYALPDELVDIEYNDGGGRYVECALVDVIEASERRVKPFCAHYGACGGCSIQHADYEYTLKLKTERLTDALKRIGGMNEPPVKTAVGCGAGGFYRNKAEYPIVNGAVGMFVSGGKRVIPIDTCGLQHPASVNAAITLSGAGLLRGAECLVTRINGAGEFMLIVCGERRADIDARAFASAVPDMISLYYCQLNANRHNALDGELTHVFGETTLTETLMGLEFIISPKSFFQVNTAQANKLYALALEAASINAECRVLDAYCGTGTITLAAAREAKLAVGVEISQAAIADANANARINGLNEKARFICSDAARAIPEMHAFDRVIIDPPRSGADKRLIDAVIKAKPECVAYVSCDPATLARDVKRFREGGYALNWAQPVDMFPWTSHIETVTRLVYGG